MSHMYTPGIHEYSSAWESDHYQEPPTPCQYCSMMAGAIKECDQTCDTLTRELWLELTEEPT